MWAKNNFNSLLSFPGRYYKIRHRLFFCRPSNSYRHHILWYISSFFPNLLRWKQRQCSVSIELTLNFVKWNFFHLSTDNLKKIQYRILSACLAHARIHNNKNNIQIIYFFLIRYSNYTCTHCSMSEIRWLSSHFADID